MSGKRWWILVALGCAVALAPAAGWAENIEVVPTAWDYGDVEVGATEPMSFIATSLGPTPLYVQLVWLVDNDGDFAVLSVVPEEPTYLDEGETMEIVVDFTPSAEGMSSASLLILSDAGNYPELYIPLQGVGVDVEPTPDEMMDAILAYYLASVANGTIYGLGAGYAPDAHLRIFFAMLDAADDLIVAGDYEAACDELGHADDKSDGLDSPPDFLGGPGVGPLNSMIGELMDVLGC